MYGVKEFVCLSVCDNYPDSPHSQGGMKFAAQISPLLNFLYLVDFSSLMDQHWEKELL